MSHSRKRKGKKNKVALVVEDDPSLRNLLNKHLSRSGYSVLETSSATRSLQMASGLKPDIVLLDWALGSKLKGIDVCAQLKQEPKTRHVPIIIMTGVKIGFNAELTALSNGADLYLTKDEMFSKAGGWSRFMAYMEALLSRTFKFFHHPSRPARTCGIEFDLKNHRIRIHNKWIHDLSTKQFDILYLLAQKCPRIVSRKYLVRYIWMNSVRDRDVDLAICRLRSRIKEEGLYPIETVVGQGYRLQPQSIMQSSAHRP